MELRYSEAYAAKGLGRDAIEKLSVFGDLLLGAAFNVTSIRDPETIELFHFLDCLSLLDLAPVRSAKRVADLGSGAGLPALLLALTLPGANVTAIESQQKKCRFIEQVASRMCLRNVEVQCLRAEDYGRTVGRSAHDVVVSRALAVLSAVAEYSFPLLSPDGTMIAMKGEISNEERIQAQKALDILGGGGLESVKLEPFAGAENRWVYVSRKLRPTPARYPRRVGMPTRRPLGC